MRPTPGHVSRTYPLVELCHGHGDQLGLPVALQLEEARLFLDDLAEEEREQLFMVARLCEILAEALYTYTRARSQTVMRGRGDEKRCARAAASF